MEGAPETERPTLNATVKAVGIARCSAAEPAAISRRRYPGARVGGNRAPAGPKLRYAQVRYGSKKSRVAGSLPRSGPVTRTFDEHTQSDFPPTS